MSSTIKRTNPRGDLKEVLEELDALLWRYRRDQFVGDPADRRRAQKNCEWARSFRNRLITGRRPEPRVNLS